jgi:lipid-binding SYLF domain-containing protein
MPTLDPTRRTVPSPAHVARDGGAARPRRRRFFLLTVLWLFLSLSPAVGNAADLGELEEIVDEARLTFARFAGHPNLTWFQDRTGRASAIFIAPRVTRAGFLFGASRGTGVLLVRDRSTGRWSEPAFYSLTGASFGLQIGVLTSEIVAVATNDDAAAEMLDGAFTLGVGGTVGIGQMGGGLSGSLETTSGTGFVTLATTTGLFAGAAVGATLVLVRDGANELYYGQPVALSDLNEGRVHQWYSERLMRTVSGATGGVRERSP